MIDVPSASRSVVQLLNNAPREISSRVLDKSAHHGGNISCILARNNELILGKIETLVTVNHIAYACI